MTNIMKIWVSSSEQKGDNLFDAEDDWGDGADDWGDVEYNNEIYPDVPDLASLDTHDQLKNNGLADSCEEVSNKDTTDIADDASTQLQGMCLSDEGPRDHKYDINIEEQQNQAEGMSTS